VHTQLINKRILKKIYEKIDAEKFLSHYRAKITGRNGPWLRMHCILPGHQDTTPSANFNTEIGIYKCFTCTSKAISFYKLVQHLEQLNSFEDAIEFVKKKVGYEDDGNYIDDLLNEIDDIQNEIKDNDEDNIIIDVDISQFDSALNHYDIAKKRVNDKMIKFWDIRYATKGYYKGRLIIPIKSNGKIVSFCACDMTRKAEKWLKVLKKAKKDKLTVTEIDELREKYECKKILYPPVIVEEPKKNIIYGSSISTLMFNFDEAIHWNNTHKQSDYVILVEGAFDAIKLFSLGFNAVAILGTSLSDYNRHRILANFDKVYVALDNDIKENDKNPGQIAAEKIIKSLKNNIETYNILLPAGKDPDECDEEEFEHCFNDAVYFE